MVAIFCHSLRTNYAHDEGTWNLLINSNTNFVFPRKKYECLTQKTLTKSFVNMTFWNTDWSREGFLCERIQIDLGPPTSMRIYLDLSEDYAPPDLISLAAKARGHEKTAGHGSDVRRRGVSGPTAMPCCGACLVSEIPLTKRSLYRIQIWKISRKKTWQETQSAIDARALPPMQNGHHGRIPASLRTWKLWRMHEAHLHIKTWSLTLRRDFPIESPPPHCVIHDFGITIESRSVSWTSAKLLARPSSLSAWHRRGENWFFFTQKDAIVPVQLSAFTIAWGKICSARNRFYYLLSIETRICPFLWGFSQ